MIEVGKKRIRLAETHSTNIYAGELLQSIPLPEGTVIVAGFQSGGRGQQQSRWESERDKNLLASFVFYPGIPLHEVVYFNKLVALSVYECVAEIVPGARIKWPNDLLVGEKKIAGILIENNIRSQQIQHLVAGIGLNINQELFGSYKPPATSLFIESGKESETEKVLDRLCFIMTQWHHVFIKKEYSKISNTYKQALFGLNERRLFKTGAVIFSGIIRGVNEHGQLVIETGNGLLKQFHNKEVEYCF